MAWYKLYQHIFNMPFHLNERGRRWRSKAKLMSPKGLIQKEMNQNSLQSLSFLFFIIFTWHDVNDKKNLFNMTFHHNIRGRRWRNKAKLRSSKGLIQNKLSQNSLQSITFLFFIIFIWHDIIDINLFSICLSIATKEVGGEEVSPSWGAPKA